MFPAISLLFPEFDDERKFPVFYNELKANVQIAV